MTMDTQTSSKMDILERSIIEFHQAFGLTYEANPVSSQPDEIRTLRESLIDEEYREFKEALDEQDVEQICKEGVDLLYVVLGTLISYGVPITEVFNEVHSSNMSKLGEDGKPIHREDGKVLKGPHYRPANVQSVLDRLGQQKN